MTLALYEDALAAFQDHLPDWWAADVTTSLLYKILVAAATPTDGLSADLENLHADMTLATATADGLRSEYAYAYGVNNEQLPPTVDGLRLYIQTWAGINGSLLSAVGLLTSLLKTVGNESGTQLIFDAGGAGLTFPANGSGLPMFQQVPEVASLTFPVDNSGIPIDTVLPNASGWVLITESPSTYTWNVQTKSYLNFDRAAFARAVERLRQAHLLPAVITEVNT